MADEDDDDALAAEWEAMAGGDEDGDDGGEDMAAEMLLHPGRTRRNARERQEFGRWHASL